MDAALDTLSQLRAGKLAGARRLDLAADLAEFPSEIYDLADSLEILNLSDNALSSLPDDLPRLHKLRVIFCSGNRFTRLPEVLGRCPNLGMIGFKANRIAEVPAAALPPSLRWLVLTDNCVEELPDSIGRCQPLQKLMLAGNRLQRLPSALAHCSNLELVRLAANRLDSLPDGLLRLPKLAWLAYAGNPFSDRSENSAVARHPIRDIEWSDLVIRERLGEGASGEIFRADWQGAPDRVEAVAVKVFKGAVTSDGLPHSEMDACIAAGSHPNLIPVLGKVSGHPQGAEALVMALIPSHFTNLAGPPSLETCTRDIYPPDTRFSPEVARRIVAGVVSAVQHLHAEGIMHGDLYAHNILFQGAGESLLGDFGAASFFAPENAAQRNAMQAIEVRAVGLLLSELAAACDGALGKRLESLRVMSNRCLDSNLMLRPSLDEISDLFAKTQSAN